MYAMTFDELFELYFAKHAMTRTARPDNARHFYERHAQCWRNVPVDSITQEACQDWVDDIGSKSGTHAANRAANTMAAVFSWGVKRGKCKDNPFIGIEKFKVQSRKRFLQPTELDRFKEALEYEPPVLKDLFWMLLLTGARCGNVAAMRWDELDLELGMWHIPVTKNGEGLTVPLTIAALAILHRRLRTARTEWVFPSNKRHGKHYVNLGKPWRRILQRAQIENLRIHDLRRTVGSYMAIGGATPYIIGGLLGHKDPRSTAIYARLNLDPIRDSLESVQQKWLG